jgi:hypothetical protein
MVIIEDCLTFEVDEFKNLVLVSSFLNNAKNSMKDL